MSYNQDYIIDTRWYDLNFNSSYVVTELIDIIRFINQLSLSLWIDV